jgi:hypothetical protein
METAHLTDQHQRLNKETFEGVSGLLGDMFDIEGFTQALRSPQASHLSADWRIRVCQSSLAPHSMNDQKPLAEAYPRLR